LRAMMEEIENRTENLVVPGKTEKAKGRILLKAGDLFPQKFSPTVVNKNILITATMTSHSEDGVVLAHGAKLGGYALYMKDGHLVMAVRNGNKLTELASKTKVTGLDLNISAQLTKDGELSLTVNGSQIKTTCQPLDTEPADGLSVSHDYRNNVGMYKDELFKGSIKNLILDIK
jgi:hypothetical protein